MKWKFFPLQLNFVPDTYTNSSRDLVSTLNVGLTSTSCLRCEFHPSIEIPKPQCQREDADGCKAGLRGSFLSFYPAFLRSPIPTFPPAIPRRIYQTPCLLPRAPRLANRIGQARLPRGWTWPSPAARAAICEPFVFRLAPFPRPLLRTHKSGPRVPLRSIETKPSSKERGAAWARSREEERPTYPYAKHAHRTGEGTGGRTLFLCRIRFLEGSTCALRRIRKRE